jgi:hypothetical protein
LNERIVDELGERKFLFVLQQKEKYYSQTEIFGVDVGKKFPKISEDVTRAGSCYALGQNTACVFHLMRAMEHCVQRFGRKLKISIDPTRKNWYEIMEHVNGQIKAMPGGSSSSKAQVAKKQKYAMAASRLDHVRIVWRNDVMHPKSTYDDQEALEVLTSVGEFLKSAAALV